MALINLRLDCGCDFDKKVERQRRRSGCPRAFQKARPLRDKIGKIVGWLVKDPHTGKRTQKGLDWGRAQGLDPANYQAVAVGAGGVAALGLSGIGELAIGALAF